MKFLNFSLFEGKNKKTGEQGFNVSISYTKSDGSFDNIRNPKNREYPFELFVKARVSKSGKNYLSGSCNAEILLEALKNSVDDINDVQLSPKKPINPNGGVIDVNNLPF